jgi:FHS family glucose/mannose:H+ symporter-like MFS transporter
LVVAAMATAWLLFLLSFVLISAARGALATGINAMVADANRTARARALNTLHGVYGAGAAISPLIIGYVIGQGVPWRWTLGGTGFIWLAYGLIVYLLYRADAAMERENGMQQLDLGMLRDGAFLALFAIAFIYNGVAFSLLGWIAVFVQEASGFSTLFSLSLVSIFYVALTAGRFACALFTERLGYASTILALSIGITLTYPLVVMGLNSTLVVAGVFLTGLSLSGLFPTALAYGARLYPEQTGAVSGTLSVAMTLGAMAPPLWTGVVADAWSFQGALGANYILVLPLIFISLYLGRMEAPPEEMQKPALPVEQSGRRT